MVTDPESRCLLEQSYNESVVALELQKRENRIAGSFNGEIVSQSGSDTSIVPNMASPELKKLIAKKRRSLLKDSKESKQE